MNMIEDIIIEVDYQTFYRGRRVWAGHIPLLSLIEMADALKNEEGITNIQIRFR
jgi:hypothetical protein